MGFIVPEQFRIQRPRRDDLFASRPGDRFGVFFIPVGGGGERHQRAFKVIATDGDSADDPTVPPECAGWEHVSVSIGERGGVHRPVLPTWAEMCAVKALFWTPDCCVVQYHPPSSDYVNVHEVLHLWRHTSLAFPMPPIVAV